jgi:hypothetical protein
MSGLSDGPDFITAIRELVWYDIDQFQIQGLLYNWRSRERAERLPQDARLHFDVFQPEPEAYVGLIGESVFTGQTQVIGVTPLLDFMLVDLFDRPVSKLIHTPAALLRDKYLMRPLVLLDRSHYSQAYFRMAGSILGNDKGASTAELAGISDDEALELLKPRLRTIKTLGTYVCDYSPSTWGKSSCSKGMLCAIVSSALGAVPEHFYYSLVVLLIALFFDSSARYAMNFRYWKRPITAFFRAGLAMYIVFDLPDRMGTYIIQNDQTLRFVFLLFTLVALGMEFWCDLLWFVNMRGEGNFEIVHRFPGNVWVCRRKLRAPFGHMRNTHRIEQLISGAYNSAKNRDMVDQIFVIAYIEGLLVELVHANAKDYAHMMARMRKTGRRPRVVQLKTFSSQNPSADKLIRYLAAAKEAGYQVFLDELFEGD